MKLLQASIINIHPLTFFYLLMSLLAGEIEYYVLSLFIVLVHEMAHYISALYFCFEINKIVVLPFGAYLQLNDMYLHDIKEELCVVLAGPATHLFLFYIIQIIFEGRIEEYLLTFNSFVFIFNMLPIYPMDGHRMISLLIQSVCDLKTSLYISLKISVLSFCILSMFYFEIETFVIIVYLLQSQLQYYFSIPDILRSVYAHINYEDQSRKIIIQKEYKYKRGYNNFYIINNKLQDENEVIFNLINTSKNI